MTIRTVFAGIGVALVLVAIVLGVVAIGSPVNQRAQRLDERRIGALQNLTGAVDEYWRTHNRLPQSIAELATDPRLTAPREDPVTGHEYTYRTLTERTYQLCADFDRQSSGLYGTRQWAHPSGKHCFDLEVPDRGR